ncbi:MAG TPA: hypothetical protein VHG89_08850 [Verrucomicrobiae bacterium]|nr:hypothetical protein [Verrucomicrobiae bacterium]
MESLWQSWVQILGCLGLVVLTGCESVQDTSFAPLEAKLEAIPGGGAQYFVVVNTSGKTLHDLKFWGNIWYNDVTFPENDLHGMPVHLPVITYSIRGSSPKLEPGQEVRFKRDMGASAEGSVLYPVSRVQIAGSCIEGHFREDWQINASGQLQSVGISSHKN